MIEDTGTMIWKELRELLRQRESLRSTALSFFIPVLFWGILLPAQSGLRWVESPATIAGWAMIALLLVTLVVAEAFAGERERHTLETLLATRLSDQAILFGKIAASVIYGWGTAIAIMVLGLLTVNVLNGDGFHMYSPVVGIGALLVALLTALFASAGGCLVSLRAATVRQAQQTMGLATFVFVVPLLILPLLPQSALNALEDAVRGATATRIVMATVLFLLAIDAALVLAAMARFRRSRLVLD
jgi:ABC-2 type transport system permease protein